MQSVLSEIITLMTGGLTNMATAIGAGLSDFAKSIFVTGTGTSSDPYALSVYGGVIVIFAGVALAINLGRAVLRTIKSFGAR